MTARIISTREQLRQFATHHGLRPDWHEPDEQGITAEVRGQGLDNALPTGEWYGLAGMRPGDHPRAELHVVFYRATRYEYPGEPVAVVNLANLCAWAAQA